MIMKQTSRHRILDNIELIGNAIASCSHYQELLNSNNVAFEKKAMYEYLLEQNIKLRRDCMSLIEKVDENLWCALKHAIGQWQYATELYYADIDNAILKEIQQRASDIMYETLSQYMGMEMTTCGRCLNDQLTEKDTTHNI